VKNKKSHLGFIAALSFVFILTGCANVPKKNTISERAKIIAGELLGKREPWISEHLGQPTFKRLDGNAQLWQYKTNECILNIFIYEDIEGGQRRVLHFDASDFSGKSVERVICLNSI